MLTDSDLNNRTQKAQRHDPPQYRVFPSSFRRSRQPLLPAAEDGIEQIAAWDILFPDAAAQS